MSKLATKPVIKPRQDSLVLGPKASISFQCPSCQKQFRTLFCLQKSIATKPCVEIGRMSNQWEAVFVNGIFIYKVFGEVMAKFCEDPDLCRKVQYVQIFLDSATRPIFDFLNS
jgi:hypothetical protein